MTDTAKVKMEKPARATAHFDTGTILAVDYIEKAYNPTNNMLELIDVNGEGYSLNLTRISYIRWGEIPDPLAGQRVYSRLVEAVADSKSQLLKGASVGTSIYIFEISDERYATVQSYESIKLSEYLPYKLVGIVTRQTINDVHWQPHELE